jgi:RNA polymerase sigma-70 factor (ECF subfamily)
MTRSSPDTDELLNRAASGDNDARSALLQRHRGRLKRMISLRMDPRLAARLDASDIVQETLTAASRRLERYLRERPVPFYPWLRQLAWDRLVEQHRRHLHARRRSVLREQAEFFRLSAESAARLAQRLLTPGDGPGAQMQQREVNRLVRAALERLPDADREVLVLRYLEQLSAREVGAVLGLSEEAAKKRALRALKRLRELLPGDISGGTP